MRKAAVCVCTHSPDQPTAKAQRTKAALPPSTAPVLTPDVTSSRAQKRAEKYFELKIGEATEKMHLFNTEKNITNAHTLKVADRASRTPAVRSGLNFTTLRLYSIFLGFPIERMTPSIRADITSIMYIATPSM